MFDLIIRAIVMFLIANLAIGTITIFFFWRRRQMHPDPIPDEKAILDDPFLTKISGGKNTHQNFWWMCFFFGFFLQNNYMNLMKKRKDEVESAKRTGPTDAKAKENDAK